MTTIEILSHRGPVAALAAGPDGEWVVSGGIEDGTVACWSAGTGDLLWRSQAPGAIDDVAPAPRSPWIAVTTRSYRIVLLDRADGRELDRRVVEWPDGEWIAPRSVAVHPSGDVVLTGLANGNLMLWEVGTETLHPLEAGSPLPIERVGIGPDGAFTWYGAQGGPVHVVGPGDRPVRTLGGPAFAIARGPSGAVAAGGHEPAILDPATLEPVRPLADPPERLDRLAISPDGATVAGLGRREVALWSVERGERLASIPFEVRAVSMALTPGRIWLGFEDGTVRGHDDPS